ncbi:hypothetical protein IW140_001187 [Coemansia sp. RSA 1813]|nr:hypothetical protein EV178_004944 [Coemansia sp. RSA 1646]KAJ1770007.1 hypothetical protein LPJ74_003581 [Coemansia sp. RSA 1843]KAJ2216570.1 hypothetical protein EV179_001109 [Coemansia sp. RSA 487]KAJ2572147.1 hypothetical protein IW140_001187 [Coemansia sp. RSA 1813]
MYTTAARVSQPTIHPANLPDISELLSTSEEVWIKRRPLPTITSIKYTIPTDPYLLASKFQKMVHEGKTDDAVAIVMQAKTKYQSDVLWNLVIDVYAKKGRLSKALRASTEMRRRGFSPTQTTFTALLKACALSDGEKSLPMAENIYRSMADSQVEPSIIHVNALLSVYQHKHKVQPILNIYNKLPADGPMAPTLTTYTLVLSTLRRELNLRIDELKNEPMEKSVEKKEKKMRLDRRTAHIKQNIRDTFDTMMLAWHSYTDDAARRIASPDASDTPPLHIDAHIVNVVLKTCHAVYSINRALGRKGLKIAEQVYGLDKTLDVGNRKNAVSPPTQKAQQLPIAARIRSPERRKSVKGMSKHDIINIDTIDLVLELCKRDKEPTKAVRFWKSLENHFAGDLEPLKSNFTDRIEEFRARMSRNTGLENTNPTR